MHAFIGQISKSSLPTHLIYGCLYTWTQLAELGFKMNSVFLLDILNKYL